LPSSGIPRSPLSGTTPLLRHLFSWINLVAPGLLLVGAYGAVFEWRPGAYVMVAALTLSVFANLAVGALAYRQTMNCPWPRVQPLRDDDDW
jgi:hypothetical protein